MNKLCSLAEFTRIATILESQEWIFAKTMPKNPHWYCLRKNYVRDQDFIDAVDFIWKYGYPEMFGGYKYIDLDINDHFYWCMSHNCFIGQDFMHDQTATILINRKPKKPESYSSRYRDYGDMFEAEKLKDEDSKLQGRLGFKGGSVLEVGYGDGTGLELLRASGKVTRYSVVDPAPGVINELKPKLIAEYVHRRQKPDSLWADEDYDLVRAGGIDYRHHKCTFEALANKERYDLVVSFYGNASNINPLYTDRAKELLNPGGRYFLMFETYGIPLLHNGKTERWGTYTILEGEH